MDWDVMDRKGKSKGKEGKGHCVQKDKGKKEGEGETGESSDSSTSLLRRCCEGEAKGKNKVQDKGQATGKPKPDAYLSNAELQKVRLARRAARKNKGGNSDFNDSALTSPVRVCTVAGQDLHGLRLEFARQEEQAL